MCASNAGPPLVAAKRNTAAAPKNADALCKTKNNYKDTTKTRHSRAAIRRAKTIAREVHTIAQKNVCVSTCVCRMRTVKTRRAAKRLSGYPKAHAKRLLGKTAESIAAASAHGITDGGQTGRARVGAKSIWQQLLQVLCKLPSAKNANY